MKGRREKEDLRISGKVLLGRGSDKYVVRLEGRLFLGIVFED